MLRNLHAQIGTYRAAIDTVTNRTIAADSVVLAFARASDFVVVKTSVVFLGFVLALLGAL